jgi:uncharacterized protein
MVTRTYLTVISRARHGDAQAQLGLARLYLNGEAGVAKNDSVALEWLRKAAAQGLQEAMRVLCEQIDLDLVLASAHQRDLAHLLREAAQAGNPRAQWAYLVLFEKAADAMRAEHADAQTIATHFLEEMARQDCPEAQWKLSEWLHRLGDVEAARHWAVDAARQNHLTARVWLATCLIKEGSTSEFERVGAPAVDVLLARAGPLQANENDLLFHFFKQRDWSNEPARAALIKAAESGHIEAAWELGRLHLNTERLLYKRSGTSRAEEEAIERLIGPAAAPTPDRPTPSLRRAVQWLNLAAAGGHADAAFMLGLIFRMPSFSRRDITRSDFWFVRAANAGQADAQFWLGHHYWRLRGKSLEHRILAVQWLGRAAQAGLPAARGLLQELHARAATPCDWPADAIDDAFIASVMPRHPRMAMRLAIGKAFQLKRSELLLTDWQHADRQHSLLLDLADWTSKHTRRVLPILAPEQRQLLDAARLRFRGVDNSAAGPEGNYRQRMYLYQKLIKQARDDRLRRLYVAEPIADSACPAYPLHPVAAIHPGDARMPAMA